MYVYIDLITNNFLRKLTFSWEEFLTLVFIEQTFYYWSAMIRACSQQLSASWDFAEKSFEHSISLHILFYYWSDMIQASSQLFSENWDFAEKSFEHTFSLQTLLIIDLQWFRVVLSNFQNAEKSFEHIFFHS